MQVGLQIQMTSTASAGRVRVNNKALCVAIVERGKSGELYHVSSTEQYLKEHGTPLDESAKLAFQILEDNIPIILVPVAHYTDVNDTSTIEGTKASVDIGSTALTTVKAKEVGAGYNDIKIIVSAPVSGIAGVFDVKVTTPEGGLQSRSGVPESLTETDRKQLNEFFRQVDFTGTGTTELVEGTYTLSGGNADKSLITAVDIAGSPSQRTGVNALRDADAQTVAMFNFFSDHAVCAEFDNVANETARMHYYAPTKQSTREEIETYLDASSARSMFSRMVAGDVRAIDPVTKTRELFPATGKVATPIMRKNSVAIYESAVQQQFNRLQNVSNVGKKFTKNDRNILQAKGVNMVINNGGAVEYFGFRTTEPNPDLPIGKEDVADLAIYLIRWLHGTWDVFKGKKNTQDKVRLPFYNRFVDEMKSLARAGAVSGFDFVGDQDVQNSQAINNTPEELNAGIWTPKITVSGIAGLNNLQIGMEVTSGVLTTSLN